MKSLGNNIKRKREELKLSQEFVADKLGITSRAYQNYEYGREPRMPTLRKIAKIFNITVEQLLNEQFVPNDFEKEDNAIIIKRLREIQANLEKLLQGQNGILEEELITRATVRGFGQYEVMKNAQDDDKTMHDIMVQINKLIASNLVGMKRKDSHSLGGK